MSEPLTSHSPLQPPCLRVGLFTDNHVLPRNLIADTPAYHRYLAGSPKLLTESEGVTKAALASISDMEATTLFHIGDLTKDGEHASHQLMADLFEQWQLASPKRRVLLIPGNHDVNNDEGMNYNTAAGEPESLPRFTPADFRACYEQLVYGRSDVRLFRDSAWYQTYRAAVNAAFPNRSAIAKDYAHGDLSYVTRLVLPLDTGEARGVTVFGMDSNNYSPEVTDAKDESKETNGSLSAAQLSWFLDEVACAKARHDLVIVLSHHAIIPHFYRQDQLMSAYVIDNWAMPFGPYAEELFLQSTDERLNGKTPKDIFAENGVRFVFSGHSHVNNVAHFTTHTGQSLYDITTASTIAYPSSVRELTISAQENYTYTMTSVMHDLETVTYQNLNGEQETVHSFWRQGEKLRFDADFVQGAGDYFFQFPAYQLDVYRLLRRRRYPDTAEEAISDALVEELRTFCLRHLNGKWRYRLTTLPLLGSWSVSGYWADEVTQIGGRHYQGPALVVRIASEKRHFDYFIAADKIRLLIDQFLSHINEEVFSDVKQLQKWLVAIVTEGLRFHIGPERETLEQLLNFLYLSFQYGDVAQPDWVKWVRDRLDADGIAVVYDFLRALDPVLAPIFQKISHSLAYGAELPLLEPLTNERLSEQVMGVIIRQVEHHYIGTSLENTLGALHYDRYDRLLSGLLTKEKVVLTLNEALSQAGWVIDSLVAGERNRFAYDFAFDRNFTLTVFE
ncbi:MAG: metallophosphoesterase [Aerococcus sp.]|nr:metallophosphoesterase [Aerococcus sp.]